jgi:hypothetical protein
MAHSWLPGLCPLDMEAPAQGPVASEGPLALGKRLVSELGGGPGLPVVVAKVRGGSC